MSLVQPNVLYWSMLHACNLMGTVGCRVSAQVHACIHTALIVVAVFGKTVRQLPAMND